MQNNDDPSKRLEIPSTRTHTLALSPAGRELFIALCRVVEKSSLPSVCLDAARLIRRAFRDQDMKLDHSTRELDRLHLAIGAFNPKGKRVRNPGDAR